MIHVQILDVWKALCRYPCSAGDFWIGQGSLKDHTQRSNRSEALEARGESRGERGGFLTTYSNEELGSETSLGLQARVDGP